MASRLERLLKGRTLTSGEVYTFSAITRTLSRVDFPIPNIVAVHKAWSDSLSRLWHPGERSPALSPDCLWIVQMGVDMWPEEMRARPDILQSLARDPDPKGVLPANAILMANQLRLGLQVADSATANQGIARACNTLAELQHTDWELSYLGRASVAIGQADTWRRVGEILIGHQKDGAWDSESEEVVESTSLCGLAMVEIGAAELGASSLPLACSAVLHRSMLLRDQSVRLRAHLRSVRDPEGAYAKGALLESLIERWISADSTLRLVGRDVHGGTDEIDLVVEVLSRSHLAPDVEPARFVLVECKNTSTAIGARDVRAFRDSLASRRHESSQLGVFISHAGFTEDAIRLVNEDYGRGKVIVLLSGAEMDRRFAMRQDFSSVIHQMFQEGVLKRP